MELILKAQTRTTKEKLAAMRKGGLVPAVVYGHGVTAQACSVPLAAFQTVYQKAGKSSLVTLELDTGDMRRVLIHDTQIDPLRGTITHADFYQIREDEEIDAEVKLHFTGESPAVKNFGGILVKALTEIEITCLPKDLMAEISVPLEKLVAIGDAIRVKDLQLPASVTTKLDPAAVVVTVAEQRAEEVVAAPVSEKDAIAAQEVVGKKEKEEGAEADGEKKEEVKKEGKKKE